MQNLQDRSMAFWPFVKVTGLNPKSALKSLLWVAARWVYCRLFPSCTKPCSSKHIILGLFNSQRCTLSLNPVLETFLSLSAEHGAELQSNSFYHKMLYVQYSYRYWRNFAEGWCRNSSVAIATMPGLDNWRIIRCQTAEAWIWPVTFT